jgi:hypothetical protein
VSSALIALAFVLTFVFVVDRLLVSVVMLVLLDVMSVSV